MKNWNCKWWGVGLSLVLLLLVMGCKSVPQAHAHVHVDLLTVLSELPDSLRENPFGERQGLELTSAEMDTLVKTGDVTTPKGFRWEIQFKDSLHHHLELTRTYGAEDGLKYEFLRLFSGEEPKWALVLQRADDHCCSFSRWALFEAQEAGLVDRTDLMPRLDWNDFFAPEDLPDPAPEAPKVNHYPFAMEVHASPPRIEIMLVADYFDLGLPEEQASVFLEHLPQQPKVLVWNGARFEWKGE